MRTEIIERLVRLNLSGEQLQEVLLIVSEVESALLEYQKIVEARREKDRNRKRDLLGNSAEFPQKEITPMTFAAKVDSPQYKAWRRYREQQSGRSWTMYNQRGEWDFPSEWPPDHHANGAG